MVGESANTARYAGMPGEPCHVPHHVPFRRALRSGGHAPGRPAADYTLTESTAGGVGFTAITVAWLAKMNPFGMLVVSVCSSPCWNGAPNTIQTNYKIPASAADLIIGIILFFMLGCEFFITYKLISRAERRRQHA